MEKVNYQLKLDEIIKSLDGKTPKLLLHACCGPCSSYVLEYLSNYFEITILFYNPNIYPKEEYERRLSELEIFLPKVNYKNKVNLIKDEYIPSDYYNSVKGLELLGEKSQRCFECYKLRLLKAVKYAKDNGYDYFTTTLSISPYKISSWINEIGQDLEKEYNIKYLYSDFKKNNGYKRSQELSRQYGMYRQNYCGCSFSKREREKFEEDRINDMFSKVLQLYNLGNIIKDKTKLSGGITNQVYKIDTDKESYIVKILTTKDINRYEISENISSVAHNNGIESLCAIKLNDKYVTNINGLNICVYPYFDGKVLLTKELTLEHVRLLANSLSRLHAIKIENKIDVIKYEKHDLKYLYSKLSNKECFKLFIDNYNKISNIYDKVYDSYIRLSNNYSYVHRDFNRKNVLWNSMNYKIIDWETSTIGNPSIDFFNSAWFLTNDIEEDKFNTFVKEYLKNNKLYDDYNLSVYAALIEECNWLVFSIKRALRINTNDEYEIKMGQDSINSSVTEILNYYSKIDLMLKLLDNIKK